MKQFLLTLAGVFAGLTLFFVVLPLAAVGWLVQAARPAPPPARTILTLDLRESLTDQDPNSPFAGLGGRSHSVLSAIDALRRAGQDDRVKGLLIRLPEGGLAPAAADELRLAVKGFRDSGKPVIAHSQGLYAAGVPTASYMIGAAAGELWMQPEASLQATGIVSNDLFLKRAFDKYGVKADYQQRYEYKTAVNPYLQSDYTPAHREETLGWMNSVYATELAQAAADRRTTPAALKAVLESGPLSAEDAKARGVVDRLGQVQDAEAALRAKAGDGAQLVDLFSYRASVRKGQAAPSADSTIALIGAEGPIVTGTGDHAGFGAGQTVYSDDIARAFAQAVKDRTVKAIVFRISSPGGSDTASEQILAGVRAAKAAGKPVVVSMGTYAASGGYWISSEASRIVAEPTTLTGSIGVFGGKLVTGDALGRFGLDQRQLSVGGDFAGAFGPGQPFTDTQRAAFSHWMDGIYDGFVQRVATGRRLSPDRVREIAKGRVWTGEQAQRLGLVDSLGGLYQAVSEAKRLAGLPASGPVTLKRMPARRSLFDGLQRAAGLEASLRQAAVAGALVGGPQAQPFLSALRRAQLQSEGAAPVLAPTPFD